MISKLIFLTMFLALAFNAQAKGLTGANDHLLNSSSRENCRLNVPSHLVEIGEAAEGVKRFQVFPLRQKVTADFCQRSEVVEVSSEFAKTLKEESELYTEFMTLAVRAMANGAGESRDGLSVGDKFSLDLDLEVFNYQVANLIQGDKCSVNTNGAISVVGFLGPKGVLLRYGNDTQVNEEECPNGTIALLDQSEFQNLNR